MKQFNKLIVFLLIVFLFSSKTNCLTIFGANGYKNLIDQFHVLLKETTDEKKDNFARLSELLKRIGDNAIKDVENNIPLRAYLSARDFFPANINSAEPKKLLSETINNKIRRLEDLAKKTKKVGEPKRSEPSRVSVFTNGYKKKIDDYKNAMEAADKQISNDDLDNARKTLNEAAEILKFIEENGKRDLIDNTPLRAYFAAHQLYPQDKIYEERGNTHEQNRQVILKGFDERLNLEKNKINEKRQRISAQEKPEEKEPEEKEPPKKDDKDTVTSPEELKKNVDNLKMKLTGGSKALAITLGTYVDSLDSHEPHFQEKYNLLKEIYKLLLIPTFNAAIEAKGKLDEFKEKYLPKTEPKPEEPIEKDPQVLLAELKNNVLNLNDRYRDLKKELMDLINTLKISDLNFIEKYKLLNKAYTTLNASTAPLQASIKARGIIKEFKDKYLPKPKKEDPNIDPLKRKIRLMLDELKKLGGSHKESYREYIDILEKKLNAELSKNEKEINDKDLVHLNNFLLYLKANTGHTLSKHIREYIEKNYLKVENKDDEPWD